MQGPHGFGDEFQGRTVGQQVRCGDFTGVGVDLRRLVHQRVPATPADFQMRIGVAWQAEEAGFQAWDFLRGDLDRFVQADLLHRQAVA
ncbi:hypothetical protein D9M71_200870 [compost metagenome]